MSLLIDTREPFAWRPLTSRDAYPVNGPYVEHVYLPKIGPTATLLLRRLPVLLSSDPRSGDPMQANGEPVYIDQRELAKSLGVGLDSLLAARKRLVQFWLLGMDDFGTWTVPALVPPMGPSLLRTLPEPIQRVEKALR